MNNRESLIKKQEQAAKQQELLEKRRRAKAEYNTSSSKPARIPLERKAGKPKRQKQEAEREIFARRAKKAAGQKAARKALQRADGDVAVSVSQWFLSICWLKIPVIGFFYALMLALGRRTPEEKRNFARGYLLYRALVLLLAATILYVVYRVGLDFIEQLLSYAAI